MKSFRSGLYSLALLAILLALCTEEVEGRRKILMGRKSLTRTYLRDNAIPSYAIIILVGIGEIIIGGIMYIVMRKVIIEAPMTGQYSVAATSEP